MSDSKIDEIIMSAGPIPESRRKALLDRYACLRGSEPRMAIEGDRPPVAEGQIWVLRESAGLPNLLVCIAGGGADSRPDVFAAYGISENTTQSADRDYIVESTVSPLETALMIETWNSVLIGESNLNHCVGSLSADQIRAVRETRAQSAATASQPKIRWPGDSRIEFQSTERKRYALADRMARLNATELICSVDASFPVETRRPANDSRGLVRLAAKAGTTTAATLKVYKPVLEHASVRVILVVWADGGVGVAVETDADNIDAEFVTRDQELISAESSSIGKNARLWKLSAAKDIWHEGFDCAIKAGPGIVTVAMRPDASQPGQPQVSEFALYAEKFEASGERLEELLKSVAACDDAILRHLMEEDVKQIIRMGREHPSWPGVYAVLGQLGTTNLRAWAEGKNGR